MLCREIYNGLYKTTSKRDELEKKIKGFIQSNNSALFLTGHTKIGKTISILKIMDNLDLNFLYIDFKYINNLKNNDKNIYLFQ